jgi:UDPglucose 6-dehydrogenase
MKNICCIGAGYVGGPTMAVIALKCPNINVKVVDVDIKKINAWNGPLNELPVFEPGLKSVIDKTRNKNLFFSEKIDEAIQEAEMIFMAVNTPTKNEGPGAGMAADLKYIDSCTKRIAKTASKDKIIIEKSTLPVRTAERIKEILKKEGRKGVKFEVISNPEFLAEGTAIQDLFKSDRVLIGGDSTKSGQEAVNKLMKIYLNWIPKEKILTTNVWSSELTKLASNAMLAQRISSINSLSALCEKTGADIDEVSMGIGMDHRIGSKFLKVSVGFGGSCFQKDILNLVYLCRHYGLEETAEYWHQVVKINDYQKKRFAKKIVSSLDGSLKDKKVSILGWAFKKGTNDSRESPAIYISSFLLEKGATICVYDPMIGQTKIKRDLEDYYNKNDDLKENFSSLLNKKLFAFDNVKEALLKADAIAIITEWDEFKNYDWEDIKENISNNAIVFDGRNILSKKNGINFFATGK